MGKSEWDIPVIGDWMTRTASIKNILAIPCSPSPKLWVEAVFWGTPMLIGMLFKPDRIDSDTGHGGRGRKGKRIMRVTSFGVKIAEKAATGALDNVVFDMAEMANRVGWWFLIADVAFNEALYWTSLVYQWAGCLPGTAGPCELELGPWPVHGGEAGEPSWYTVTDPDHWGAVTRISVPAGVQATIGCSVKGKPWHGDPGNTGKVSGGLYNVDTGNRLFGFKDVFADASAGRTSAAGMFTMSAQSVAQTYAVRYVASGGWTDMEGSTFYASNGETFGGGILQDP